MHEKNGKLGWTVTTPVTTSSAKILFKLSDLLYVPILSNHNLLSIFIIRAYKVGTYLQIDM